jgi:uncharacterized protein YbjT (DUF2867 family)
VELNAELEQAVIASGLEWVSLRPNEYASKFLGLWAAQLRSGNVIRALSTVMTISPLAVRRSPRWWT